MEQLQPASHEGEVVASLLAHAEEACFMHLFLAPLLEETCFLLRSIISKKEPPCEAEAA
jgi:hypothetical protein